MPQTLRFFNENRNKFQFFNSWRLRRRASVGTTFTDLGDLSPNLGGGMPDLQPQMNNLAEDMRVKFDWHFDEDAPSRFKSWGLLMPSIVDSF